MKNKTLFILIIFFCSLSKTVYGSNLICELTKYNCPSVDYEELVKVENLYHKKFDDKPFTGEVIGRLKGFVKRGEMMGKWSCFNEKGMIIQQTNFKNNLREGQSTLYYDNGATMSVALYKNGKYLERKIYSKDGKLLTKYTTEGDLNTQRINILTIIANKKCDELSD